MASAAAFAPNPRLRAAIGLLLMVPVPLLWWAAMIYFGRDLHVVPHWVGTAGLLSVPFISSAGAAILPMAKVSRIVVGVIVVPLVCYAALASGFVLACTWFGDCL